MSRPLRRERPPRAAYELAEVNRRLTGEGHGWSGVNAKVREWDREEWAARAVEIARCEDPQTTGYGGWGDPFVDMVGSDVPDIHLAIFPGLDEDVYEAAREAALQNMADWCRRMAPAIRALETFART